MREVTICLNYKDLAYGEFYLVEGEDNTRVSVQPYEFLDGLKYTKNTGSSLLLGHSKPVYNTIKDALKSIYNIKRVYKTDNTDTVLAFLAYRSIEAPLVKEESTNIPITIDTTKVYGFIFGRSKGWIQRNEFEGTIYIPFCLDRGVSLGNCFDTYRGTLDNLVQSMSTSRYNNFRLFEFDNEKELFRWLGED